MSPLFNENICHLTYTHSSYSDLWPIYFAQMKKYFSVGMDHHVAVENSDVLLPKEVTPVVYKDSDAYSERLISVLEKLEGYELVFFDHEDMFLYAEPDYLELTKYFYYLHSGSLDYIRLIKGGNCEFQTLAECRSLHEFDMQSEWIFSIQPSFWRRTSLIELITLCPKSSIWELEVRGQDIIRRIRARCAFSHRSGIKRGLFHFDNDVYPYIATSIVKGKWNLSEYSQELSTLLNKYRIDPTIRGVR